MALPSSSLACMHRLFPGVRNRDDVGPKAATRYQQPPIRQVLPAPTMRSWARDPSSRSEVLVLGAGAIGLCVAWRLARLGRRVTVVGPDPGRGAIWAAAGMLAPASEAHFGDEGWFCCLSRRLGSGRASPATSRLRAGRPSATGAPEPCWRAEHAADRLGFSRIHSLQRSLGLEVHESTGSGSPSWSLRSLSGLRLRAPRARRPPGRHEGAGRRAPRRARAPRGPHRAGRGRRARRRSQPGLARWGSPRRRPARALPRRGPLQAGRARRARPSGHPAGQGHVLRLFGPSLLERTVRGTVRGRSIYLVPREGCCGRGLGRIVWLHARVQAGERPHCLHDARRLLPGIDERWPT